MDRAMRRIGFEDWRAALISEKIDRVRGVMPQQMIGPGARLSQRVHIGAAEEKGLHVHLLNMEFVLEDALAHELMARVEAAGMADHGDEAALFLRRNDRLGVLQAVGERNLD